MGKEWRRMSNYEYCKSRCRRQECRGAYCRMQDNVHNMALVLAEDPSYDITKDNEVRYSHIDEWDIHTGKMIRNGPSYIIGLGETKRVCYLDKQVENIRDLYP